VAGPHQRRWGVAVVLVVVVVAVVLVVLGAMAIVLGLVGRVSSGPGGLVPDDPAPSGTAVAAELVLGIDTHEIVGGTSPPSQ
jgi:hypothetical protein